MVFLMFLSLFTEEYNLSQLLSAEFLGPGGQDWVTGPSPSCSRKVCICKCLEFEYISDVVSFWKKGRKRLEITIG